jgi:hypothetical protein
MTNPSGQETTASPRLKDERADDLRGTVPARQREPAREGKISAVPRQRFLVVLLRALSVWPS